MKLLEVKNSSNINGATYDAKTKKVLVRFHNGSVYEYADVPFEIWKRFQATFDGSSSAGKFLNANFKGKFDYRQLDEDEIESLGIEA